MILDVIYTIYIPINLDIVFNYLKICLIILYSS